MPGNDVAVITPGRSLAGIDKLRSTDGALNSLKADGRSPALNSLDPARGHNLQGGGFC
jgi:hypothetical protein